MLVTTKEMLLDAQKNHYAVGAFNVENLEFVMAVLAAAEETKSPVIMQTTPGTIKTAGLDYFYGMVAAAAAASHPACPPPTTMISYSNNMLLFICYLSCIALKRTDIFA